MCRSSYRLLVLCAWIVSLGLATSVGADTTRWGDGGGGTSGGSFELTYEKRLFEPGPEEQYCRRCANYLEIHGELDEVDRQDGSEVDVTAFAVGYRRYFFPFRVDAAKKADHWRRDASAIFTGFGLGAYEVDRVEGRESDVYAGWFARAGLLVPLTHACRIDAEGVKRYRGFYLDGTVSYIYNEIETPGANLDYNSVRIGLRLNFPSKRDHERADNLLRYWDKVKNSDKIPEGAADPCPGR